jgi:hypothetical protein
VADLDAFYVGDGVVGAGSAVEGNAEIAGAGLGWAGAERVSARTARRKKGFGLGELERWGIGCAAEGATWSLRR